MYHYHADAHNAETPYRRLYTSRGSWRRYRRYIGFLDGAGLNATGITRSTGYAPRANRPPRY